MSRPRSTQKVDYGVSKEEEEQYRKGLGCFPFCGKKKKSRVKDQYKDPPKKRREAFLPTEQEKEAMRAMAKEDAVRKRVKYKNMIERLDNVDVSQLLDDIPLREELEEFAAKEFSKENIDFLMDVKNQKNKEEIGEKYIFSSSPDEINIQYDTRDALIKNLKNPESPYTIFDKASLEVSSMLMTDVLPRFRRYLQGKIPESEYSESEQKSNE